MKVHLKPRWESKVFVIKPRNLFGNDFCCDVNETFDEMYYQGQLKFTTNSIPFSFPVFVIWKPDSNGKMKGRTVVDIRKLNEIVLPDSYLLLL